MGDLDALDACYLVNMLPNEAVGVQIQLLGCKEEQLTDVVTWVDW